MSEPLRPFGAIDVSELWPWFDNRVHQPYVAMLFPRPVTITATIHGALPRSAGEQMVPPSLAQLPWHAGGETWLALNGVVLVGSAGRNR